MGNAMYQTALFTNVFIFISIDMAPVLKVFDCSAIWSDSCSDSSNNGKMHILHITFIVPMFEILVELGKLENFYRWLTACLARYICYRQDVHKDNNEILSTKSSRQITGTTRLFSLGENGTFN